MVGLILICDLRYYPYLKKYESVLQACKSPYEVLFWNREGESALEGLAPNYIPFPYQSDMGMNKLRKIPDYLKFRKWLIAKIRERRYEKLMLLSTLAGMCVVDQVLRRYKGKYIFDIRDDTYEGNPIYFHFEEKLIRRSWFTCISSRGFTEFLPKNYEYVISHNFMYSDLPHARRFVKKPVGSRLCFAWIGLVRFYDHQIKIIARLKNDPRFELKFYGSGPDLQRLRDYCARERVENVEFTGAYRFEDKPALLERADILNNNYGNADGTRLCMSNKYYDGLIYGIPQLVDPGTYKQALVLGHGVGVCLHVDEPDFADKMYDYYYSIDENAFNAACERAKQEFLDEDETYMRKIREFVTNA